VQWWNCASPSGFTVPWLIHQRIMETKRWSNTPRPALLQHQHQPPIQQLTPNVNPTNRNPNLISRCTYSLLDHHQFSLSVCLALQDLQGVRQILNCYLDSGVSCVDEKAKSGKCLMPCGELCHSPALRRNWSLVNIFLWPRAFTMWCKQRPSI
jgi:hypothetical protein